MALTLLLNYSYIDLAEITAIRLALEPMYRNDAVTGPLVLSSGVLELYTYLEAVVVISVGSKQTQVR